MKIFFVYVCQDCWISLSFKDACNQLNLCSYCHDIFFMSTTAFNLYVSLLCCLSVVYSWGNTDNTSFLVLFLHHYLVLPAAVSSVELLHNPLMVYSVSLSLPLLRKRMNATVYLKRNIDAHFQWYLVAVFRTKSTFENFRGLAFTRTSRWHWCHMAFLSSTNFCIVILPKIVLFHCAFNSRLSF